MFVNEEVFYNTIYFISSNINISAHEAPISIITKMIHQYVLGISPDIRALLLVIPLSQKWYTQIGLVGQFLE